MVQVLAAVPRNKTFGQKLNEGLGEALNFGQQMMQQQAQRQAVESLGLDPHVLNLPEQAQIEYFKRVFQPEKQETSLETARRQKIEQEMKSNEENNSVFQNVFGGLKPQEDQNQPTQNTQNFNPPFKIPEQETGQSPTKNKVDFSQIPRDKLQAMAAFAGQPGNKGVYGTMAKTELERQEKEEKNKTEFAREGRKESFDINKPIHTELQQARKNIPLQEQAIEDIKNAAPEVGLQDYIADLMGFEPGRTPEGAKLKTAIKDFFLSDLTRAGARPNMWIEQQLADALPKVGRDPAANLITAAGLQFKVDLAKKRVQLLDEISERDVKKQGFEGRDWDAKANALMKPYIEQRKKELIDEITKIKSQNKVEKGFTRMTNPETGESYDILEGNVKEALKAGWKKI